MWWQDTQTRQQQAISKIKEMIYSCSIGWISMNIFIKLQIKKLLKISEEYFGEKYWSSCSGDSAFLPTPATDPTKYPSCVTSVPAVFSEQSIWKNHFVWEINHLLWNSIRCWMILVAEYSLSSSICCNKSFSLQLLLLCTYTYKNPGLQHNRWGNVPLHLYSCQGLFIYYVIQFGGLGRPTPNMIL